MILQNEVQLNENYQKYAGKCHELSLAAIEADPTLKLVRGHYYDPIWGERAHWWTVRQDGSIYDPTALQFPSMGTGEYVEFDGMCICSECGKEVPEAEADIGGNGNYAFCSMACHMAFVGL